MAVKSYKKLRFGEWAVKLGFMDNEQLDQILSRRNITRQRIGHICIEEGLLDEEKIARIIAAQFSYPYTLLQDSPAPDLLQLIPLDIMNQHQFVPYEKKGDKLVIALADPNNFMDVADRLEMLVDMEISVVIASSKKIRQILKNFEASRNMVDTVSDDMRLPLVKESDQGEEILSFEKVSAEESQIVKLIDSTILDAINKQASDIHIEGSDHGVIIRYRIDGMLHQATDPLDMQHLSPIISRIKVMSELDIAEKRIPQDGRFKLKVMERYIDFRVSILPALSGENAVIRILDREHLEAEAGEFRLEGMELPDRELAHLKRLVKAPYGMFLMTGPTGSGKTTTLYRALSEVNRKDVKIITIEDPVEYQLKGVVQMPVNVKKGLTFARGLRSILRHDPDKILVGEIRDTETAQIALQSALTGHLVFTTVHANSSFEVINRFTHMGIEAYNLMAALNCIAAQRLIRVLCDCKTETTLTDAEMVDSGLDPVKFRGKIFYNARGCELCKGTGYKGRKAIIEIVELNDKMKELFINKTSTTELKRMAAESGTIFLRQAALREVMRGETTIEEADRVTFNI
jgi:type IV pilus assembly protein PilB